MTDQFYKPLNDRELTRANMEIKCHINSMSEGYEHANLYDTKRERKQ